MISQFCKCYTIFEIILNIFDYKHLYKIYFMNINVKSNFLEKKRQQRKKTEDQIQSKSKMLCLQKNIRAYLVRKSLLSKGYSEKNIQLILLMGADISKFNLEVMQACLKKIENQSQPERLTRQKKIILSCMRSGQANLLAFSVRIVQQNFKNLQSLFQTRTFIQELIKLLKRGQGYQLVNFSWSKIQKSSHLNLFQSQLLMGMIIQQFRGNKMEGQGVFLLNLNNWTILSILGLLNERKYLNISLTIEEFISLGATFVQCLKQFDDNVMLEVSTAGFIYMVDLLRMNLKKIFDSVVKIITQKEKLKNLISLIQDQEQLQYFEHKIKLQSEYIEFCEQTLSIIQRIFNETKNLHLLMINSQKFRSALTGFINQMNCIYEDRNILFVYHFLSNETSLKQMAKQKKMDFYSALNMKMMTMDDEDFIQSNIFDEKEWREIIQSAIAKAFDTSKKLIILGPKKQKINLKNALFMRQNQVEADLKTLSQLLTNLNKKCLRTSKIPYEFFINEDLDKFLNTFKFGVGARAIQLMLKNFPFTFRFQSRMKKLKQFIKSDKLNHDRTLFLQEQVDPELVIAVRRGHQFLDAFESCFHKDLRKKYKIVFFNQQGLQEEGIDGGGIIKEFINRVLKSSFSEIYGMFYETNQNQILPNSSSTMAEQYEFVGKLIGKAVYESINIEQKFAEPFLNLLIGRKNTFEDLKFIDKEIYRSMVQVRRMNSNDLEILSQTFTILDENPMGEKKRVNLKKISSNNPDKDPQTIVDINNKIQFVMSYADYKCNKQLEEKTRLFRKGFLTVMKSEWLTMFSNLELNMIISGSSPNYSVVELKNNVNFLDYHEKSQTIVDLWSVISEFNPEQKSAFLLYVTSCSRPPTMGFGAMKPLICIQRSALIDHLPTANTCMNILRLPDYKNKATLKQKLLYAIYAKAGFQFA